MLFILLASLICYIADCTLKLNPPPVIRTEKTNSRISRNFKHKGVGAPQVETKSGKIEGYFMEVVDEKIISAFEGIPYAEPPIGDLRFKSPVAKLPWHGILKTVSPSMECIQQQHRIIGTEDCLYLNVYTPLLRFPTTTKSLPTILFIHGGGHSIGHGAITGPAYIMAADVIFVTINYRLGLLGCLSTGDEILPGNYGLKDQAFAIDWVSQNIEQFGGNKSLITIAGVSSGAASVHLQMMSQRNSGKIFGAISMSGTAFHQWGFQPLKEAKRTAHKAAELTNCPQPEMYGSLAFYNCIKNVNAFTLARLERLMAEWFMFPVMPYGPTVEPKNFSEAFLTDTPKNLYAKGEVLPIPWINGFCSDESMFFLGPLRFLKWVFEILQESSTEALPWLLLMRELGIPDKVQPFVAKKLIQYYNKGDQFISFEEIKNILNDGLFTLGTFESSRLHSTVAPTYTYKFDFVNPYGFSTVFNVPVEGHGAGHIDDYTLIANHTFFKPIAKGGIAHTIQKFLINLLVNFASKGIPYYTNENKTNLRVFEKITDPTKLQFLEISKSGAMMNRDVAMEKRHLFWKSLGILR